MSSPEDYFGSSYPFDEMGVAAFADATDLSAAFWAEEDARYDGLFARVRNQLDVVHTQYTVGDKTNWQSFHVTPTPEGRIIVWIVHQAGAEPMGDTTRIIHTREDSDKLCYGEYVLSDNRQQSGSVYTEVDVDQTAESWTAASIGKAALIQFHEGDVEFFRGAQNQRPTATNRADRDYDTIDGRMRTKEQIVKELTEMAYILGGLSAGTYEPGAEGRTEP